MQGKPPVGRKKKVTGKADESSMQLHGSARTDGPVGSQDGYSDRKEQQSGQKQARKTGASSPLAGLFSQQAQQQRPASSGQSAQRPSSQQTNRAGSSGGLLGSLLGGGGGGKILIIVVIAALLLGGSGGLSGLFGGGGGGSSGSGLLSSLTSGSLGSLASSFLGGQSFGDNGLDLGSLVGSVLGGDAANQVSSASNSAYAVRNGVLDESVASGSRSKYTTIKGNGKDTFTVMVYMCGADLESKSAMGTKDLQEMVKATFGDNVRVIVQTGGSTAWHVKGISNSQNQIYQVKNSGLARLETNAGTDPMTDPKTLQKFIEYCKKNFSANRYALILWDHGCGSVSGYGYDENYPKNGSMSLAGLNQALSGANVKFDFIGFDACLMATVETALMASNYADYLIASEETEPGIGWYYTNWLTAVGGNTSMETLKIGQMICDDFVSTCDSQCRGQKTTLSVIDLAELAHTVPSKLTAFSKSISSMISKKDYQPISTARNGSREFAAGNRIDQVDLTDLCGNMDTKESKALAEALRSAVKYNRINNITDAHGLSVYFPYQSVSNVEKAAQTYSAIGMDASYADAIRAFAKVEASGQAVTGGTNTAAASLFGSGTSSSSGDMVSQLLSAFLGGGRSISVEGLTGDNDAFLRDTTISEADLEQYLKENLLDASQLVFRQDGGNWVLDLPAQQWALVTDAVQNAFYDNGDHYVDLGLDSLFSFDEKGRMVADMDGTWLAINGQPVAYYVEGLEEANGGWYYYGRVPAELDGVRVDLILTLNAETGDGAIAGIRFAYADGETDAVAKTVTVDEFFELLELDEDLSVVASEEKAPSLPLVFLADKYDKDQTYVGTYAFGNTVSLTRTGMEISNVELPDASKLLITYRFTDIYNQHYWTPVVGRQAK